ncbi:hypothetical protein C8Q79DRAFT_1007389 [Trametes meyenii]|nr:hypothetical protein C8Q79DRAFT_1007389 [Trametes meyenii]
MPIASPSVTMGGSWTRTYLLTEESSPPESLDSLYGAFLLGTFVSLVLYGVLVVQLYRYWRIHSGDTKFIQGLVAIVIFLETSHAALLMHTCYYYLVVHYDDPSQIGHGVWSLQVTPMVSSFITAACQIFFARRVSLIGSRYKILVAFASIALLAHVGFSVGITANAFEVGSLSGFQGNGDWLFPAILTSAVIAYFLLSAGIIHAVRRSRAIHPPSRTETTFDSAMLYVVNSGILTGVVNTAPTIAAFKLPQTLIWAGLSFVGTRCGSFTGMTFDGLIVRLYSPDAYRATVYAITLLAVLNSRTLHAGRGMEIFLSGPPGRNLIARANRLATAERWNAPQAKDAPAKIKIAVSNEVEVDTQDDRGDSTVRLDHKYSEGFNARGL